MMFAAHDAKFLAALGPIDEADAEFFGVTHAAASGVGGAGAGAGAAADGDGDGDNASASTTEPVATTLEQPGLATKLTLLKANAEKNVRERRSMRQFCKSMGQSPDTRNEMLAALKKQNVMLSRKLKAMEDRVGAQRKRARRPLPMVPPRPSGAVAGVGGGAADIGGAPDGTGSEVSALRRQLEVVSTERDFLREECAQLRAAGPTPHRGHKFKGMTVPEQAAVLDERVELKQQIDELNEELVSARAIAAKLQWELEHGRLYAQARSQTLLSILRSPLSDTDRRSIVLTLEEADTEEEEGGGGFDTSSAEAAGGGPPPPAAAAVAAR